jgi:hypothetical protein
MSRFGKLFRMAAVAATTVVAADRALAQQPQTLPGTTAGAPCPPVPCPPLTGQPGTPLNLTPSTPVTEPTPSFSSTLAGAGVGESTAINGLGGYIDNAAPVTHFRLRYDQAYQNNRPDRAEFFYAKCGCFQTRDAAGPPLPETSVDYQELAPYFEVAFAPRASVFATVPIRFINPEQNRNASGLGDVSFGAKYAIRKTECSILTLQVRAIAPSGDTFDGLGTGNWFLEPGLLWLRQVNPRWQLFGEVKDLIPLDRQSDFTGNVLRYGLGTAVTAFEGERGYVAPVVEAVGWTVLSGRESNVLGQVFSARGATIVNLKLGVRVGFGKDECDPCGPTKNDFYIGYGRALTGEVWYKDMLRLEYRRFF